jgi:hypothetical protein
VELSVTSSSGQGATSLIVERKGLPRIAPRRPMPHINRATVHRAVEAFPPQLTSDLAHAIDAKVLLEHAPDLDLQTCVAAEPVGQMGGISAPWA